MLRGHHVDQEATVRPFDGDDLQLLGAFIVPDPPDDRGLGDVVRLDGGSGGLDDVTSARTTNPVLSASAGKPDRPRFHPLIVSYTTR